MKIDPVNRQKKPLGKQRRNGRDRSSAGLIGLALFLAIWKVQRNTFLEENISFIRCPNLCQTKNLEMVKYDKE